MTYVEAATNAIVRTHARRTCSSILESTTYPGHDGGADPPDALEEAATRSGEEFFLAFSPERVDPGNPVYQVKNTPKVVGGIDAGVHGARRASVLHRDRPHPSASRRRAPPRW